MKGLQVKKPRGQALRLRLHSKDPSELDSLPTLVGVASTPCASTTKSIVSGVPMGHCGSPLPRRPVGSQEMMTDRLPP